jgi:hypothetical protein
MLKASLHRKRAVGLPRAWRQCWSVREKPAASQSNVACMLPVESLDRQPMERVGSVGLLADASSKHLQGGRAPQARFLRCRRAENMDREALAQSMIYGPKDAFRAATGVAASLSPRIETAVILYFLERIVVTDNKAALASESVNPAMSSLPANVPQGREKGLELAHFLFVCGLDCLPHQPCQAL